LFKTTLRITPFLFATTKKPTTAQQETSLTQKSLPYPAMIV